MPLRSECQRHLPFFLFCIFLIVWALFILPSVRWRVQASGATSPTDLHTRQFDGLTIFTTFRSIKQAYINSIHSWTQLTPKPEIIIFGDKDDKEAQKLAAKFKCIFRPISAYDELYHKPYMHKLFQEAQEIASYQTIMYANTDIMLLNDVMEAVQAVVSMPISYPHFLMSGRRWSINSTTVTTMISDNNGEWEPALREQLQRNGLLRIGYWMDYFVLPKTMRLNMPPFVVGLPKWDTWLINHATTTGIPSYDATEVATVVHQDHIENWDWDTPGARSMSNLAGFSYYDMIDDADYHLVRCGLSICAMHNPRDSMPFRLLKREKKVILIWGSVLVALLLCVCWVKKVELASVVVRWKQMFR